jgi:CDP-diacylglycerol---glycerol-3-phosphate 3-phosphatidyltransferase
LCDAERLRFQTLNAAFDGECRGQEPSGRGIAVLVGRDVTVRLPFSQAGDRLRPATGTDNWGLCVVRHLPNLLSASRIPAALLLLALYRPDDALRTYLSLGLVLLIMATDLLDGRLARRYGLTSEFGYMLDGLGDRAVHVAAYLILLNAEVVSAYLVWALIFRELSQYGARMVEPAWHASQARADRIVTQAYTVAVQALLLCEVARNGIAPGTLNSIYVLAVNIILCGVGIASYSRILPRLLRAWKAAASG